MERRDSGILIAVEGIDGAGKSTQVDLLADFFTSAELPVLKSKEPTDGPWGRKVRQSAAHGRMTPEQELIAFTEDRKEHLRDKIQPAIDRGQIVILDRYFYSTVAYQGSHGADVEGLYAQMLQAAPEADVVLLLDVPAEVGIARIQGGRNERPNAFETTATLNAARQIFLQLARTKPNILRIDGSAGVSTVREVILKRLLEGVLKKHFCAKPWGCDDPFNCMYRLTGTCPWAKLMRLAGNFVNQPI
jgi:dTMP kinase